MGRRTIFCPPGPLPRMKVSSISCSSMTRRGGKGLAPRCGVVVIDFVARRMGG